jgi:hypothetical protein
MARRDSTANAPNRLAARQESIGNGLPSIVYRYCRDELLRGLAHPFWFQSFGAVMSMDLTKCAVTNTTLKYQIVLNIDQQQ